MKKIIFILLVMMSFLTVAKADDYQLEIPQFKINYIDNYYDTYTCKYRLNLSPESPVYYGSFDFVINISKLGPINSVTVSQASKISDLTDMNRVSGITSKNSISNIQYKYNDGYSCPNLMAFLTIDDNDVAIFDVKNYDGAEYKNYESESTIGRYYKLHEYELVRYNCKYDEDECESATYCKWTIIDSGHREYGCVEKEYAQVEDQTPENTIRTETCKGYKESVFNQTVEYSFSIDGVLSANIGSGDFNQAYGSVNYEDKEGQLWELWQKGQCCSNDKLGVSGELGQDKIVLSCDGSEDAWQFDDDYEVDENIPPNIDISNPVYGCDVIPDEIQKWIIDTLNLVKYIALVLVIVLGALDFIKAAASGEADQMKKSGSSFLKRVIAVVVLFLVPLIVEVILNLIEIYGADSTCIDLTK